MTVMLWPWIVAFGVSAYALRRWYLKWKLKKYGIGKGVPGFQTNVKQIRITPEIAARLRRGEDVSPAEIEAAARLAEQQPPTRLPPRIIEERDDRPSANKPPESPKPEENEWLPESLTAPKKRAKGKWR